MRKVVLFFTVILTTYSYTAFAQKAKPITCNFENFFTVKPGQTKTVVLKAIEKNFTAKLISNESAKIKPPYIKKPKDSIVREIFTYSIEAGKCFLGKNSNMLVEFADGKLYKVQLYTQFDIVEEEQMLSNFRKLKSSITKTYPATKKMALKGDVLKGEGYMCTKSKKPQGKKIEQCNVQYVQLVSTVTKQKYYQLEVIWANLNNTRMESSYY